MSFGAGGPGPTLRVGITLPSFVDDPEVALAVARAADGAGVDGVFAFDHLFRGAPDRPALDCVTLLGAVAAETSRSFFGPLVARVALRPTATLTQVMDTLARIGPGRLVAAVGAGDAESRAENDAFGVGFGTAEQRRDGLRAAVVALRGRGYPVWVGGSATGVAPLVALADGWNAWGPEPEAFARAAALVRQGAPAAALTWGGLALVGADERDARRKARRLEPAPHVLVGGPERVAERLAAYRAAGAEWAVIAPLDPAQPDNAAVLGELVIPLLRAA